jgi:hypothetical protein
LKYSEPFDCYLNRPRVEYSDFLVAGLPAMPSLSDRCGRPPDDHESWRLLCCVVLCCVRKRSHVIEFVRFDAEASLCEVDEFEVVAVCGFDFVDGRAGAT